MKRLLSVCAGISLSVAALVFASGCSSNGVGLSNEPKPSVTRRDARLKATSQISPVVVKAAATPSPTPGAKGKTARKPLKKTGVPYDATSEYTIAIESWPQGVTSVDLTVKCYQITNITGISTGYSTATASPALAVFPDGSGGFDSSKVVTVSAGTPQTIYVVPGSACAGMQLYLGFTGQVTVSGTTYKFGGANIFVVNP